MVEFKPSVVKYFFPKLETNTLDLPRDFSKYGQLIVLEESLFLFKPHYSTMYLLYRTNAFYSDTAYAKISNFATEVFKYMKRNNRLWKLYLMEYIMM